MTQNWTTKYSRNYSYIPALALALAGCASVAPPAPQRVDVPVAVGCLGDVPARPVSRYGVGDWPGDKAAAQAALGDAIAWEQYATGLEAAMSGCAPRGQALTPPIGIPGR